MTTANTHLQQASIPRRPEYAGILREDENFATGMGDDVAERLNGWFDRLILQSGLEIKPSLMLSLCVFSGVVAGGALFVIQEHALSMAAAALVGCWLPIFGALVARHRRQNAILKQMPAMAEELARAARTGRSLQDSFLLVAQDTPKPLGLELQLCARKMQMGLSLGTAIKNLPERTGVVSLNVLVMALTVHMQSGGDLIRVLERLANTMRDRLLFLGRLRAATAASRATAALMISLPPAILTFFLLREPDYLTELLASSWGRGTTLAAVALQLVGSVWVLRVLNQSQRT
jgi:tight adherence protein B